MLKKIQHWILAIVFLPATAYTLPVAPSFPPQLGTLHAVRNAIPPRYQWNANFGYCGEVSMISAGLYYGQYLSQYDVRAIASPTTPQNRASAQLLLGVNDAATARHLRLQSEQKASPYSANFYSWVKHHVMLGHPVITAVYNNEYLLYDDSNPTAGDPVYDHIVPVMGFGSDSSLTENYHASDILLFSDNGLYTPTINTAPYYYPLELGVSLANRQTANAANGDIYSLPAYPVTKYGIAITGVLDTYHETVPVRVQTPVNYEYPEIAENSSVRPTPMPLTLTITASKLTPQIQYNVYYYQRAVDVPTEHFNKNSKIAGILPWKIITASSTTWSTTLKINSNNKAFFRVVRADGL